MLHQPSHFPLAPRTQHINTNVTFNADTWRAPIAATVLGPLMVLTFNILSCVILIRCVHVCVMWGWGWG